MSSADSRFCLAQMRLRLPFDQLSPWDFERLCLWLVKREGFENVEYLGETGSEQGRDIVAWRKGRRFAFQCKRVQRFTAGDARREIDKIRKLPPGEQPDVYVFVVSKAVRADTRRLAREAWGDEKTCRFWCGSELDERVKRHDEILMEFVGSVEGRSETSPQPKVRLRGCPDLGLPEEPYPLLLPYTHPKVFVGREREVAELQALLRGEVPIVLLYAPSGVGKSSLLRAGLAPGLDQEGVPVALDDRPTEAGLGRRLISGLLISDEWAQDAGPAIEETDSAAFAAFLRQVRQLAGEAPVLILDQFEELFRHPEQRGVAGLLLAASLRHQPSVGAPQVRWVLAYRQEFHGEVRPWLGDVRADARRAGLPGLDRLPHDLSGVRRSRDWALRTFATPRPGEPTNAAAAFQAAIEAPLKVRSDDGGPRYALRFAADGAARLAAAFAESRDRHPEAPLVPELQVVLAKLLRDASDSEVQVDDDPNRLIADALQEHLRSALDRVFPPTLTESHRVARSRALLALRELADTTGRRGASLPTADLARAFSPEGEAAPERLAEGETTLERLAAADTRLLVRRLEDGAPCYALSHDRMAEVVVRAVEEEERRGALDVDPKLLGLRRYINIMTRLFHAGESRQATDLPLERFEAIRDHAVALLWDGDRRAWWQACQQRRRDKHKSLVEQLSSAVAPKVLEALAALSVCGSERDSVRQRMASRTDWRRIFEQGPLGLAEREREEVLIAAVRNAAVYFETERHDLDALGVAAWAIDYFAGRSKSAELRIRAANARQALLEPLQHQRPPPEQAELPLATIPGGSFAMGSKDDKPGHEVTVSPFRMLVHPITNALFRRLVSSHEGDDDLPTVNVTWYQAYAYAAWLGGRLPTEAEWEYAARAGCPHSYCDRHGSETTLDKVGWYKKNSGGRLHPVMQLEPNPCGLYDMYGNVAEWVADWHGEDSDGPAIDPWGPPSGESRTYRGGSYRDPWFYLRAAYWSATGPSFEWKAHGFRVVFPAAPSPSRPIASPRGAC